MSGSTQIQGKVILGLFLDFDNTLSCETRDTASQAKQEAAVCFFKKDLEFEVLSSQERF